MTRLVATALVLLAACGGGIGANGTLVGAQCSVDRECVHRCVTGSNNYPGGMCTISCNSDADCAPGTACVDDHGGICVVSCVDSAACAGFGRGFVCDDEDRRGAGGRAFVCRVP
jgi:hypothetical protein